MITLDDLKAHFAKNKKALLEEYFTFLRFKSISADPTYKGEVLACADWVENKLKKMGLQVEKWHYKDHPPVFLAQTPHDPTKKTLLLYNHYDVQPVDPLELWETPPFEPNLRGNTVYARGASDNKGQCTYTLFAVQTLLESGQELPVNLKLLIEGEEEFGSLALSHLVKEKSEKLKADHILIIDAHIEKIDRPAISLGARGLVTMTLRLQGSRFDLHSGTYGGVVYNPLRALAEMTALTHDAHGRVTIPHFYDHVLPLSPQEKALYNLSFDPQDFAQTFEAQATGMAHGVAPMEAAWLEPTLEINGLCGGYSGAGFKTVIPARAEAKISARLVPNQDPDTIAESIKQFFLSHTPPGITTEVEIHPGRGRGFRTSPQTPLAKAFAKSYTEVFGTPCENILLGGSIPISADLIEITGADLILLGVALPDDQIHSPNEHFSLDRLELGYLTIAHGIQLLTRSGSD